MDAPEAKQCTDERGFVDDFMRLIPQVGEIDCVDIRESLSTLSEGLFKQNSLHEVKENLLLIKEK